ncbi:hypothetical protein N9Y81_04115 [Akkermansiaceae bacterium]|nr:hypothetical protein [Akkermansiaceae bacterium]
MADPASPAAIISGGTGITSAAGQKGVALLNLTTGNYDAAYYRSGNASAAQVFSLTLDDLTAAGVTTPANYQIDFIGGQGNQAGVSDPVGPGEVIAYNGGASDSNGLKGLAFFNQATGVYDHVVYDSQNGGDSPESITLTVAELEGGGIDLDENYRLDFLDHDDGASGWTRLESVNLLGAVIADPPPPGDLGVVWNFLNGNENGWTTVNGASWLDANGVEAGQADGVGGNDTGATCRAHDGAHTNFIYRSPMVNFGNVASEGAVVEIDFQGATGNQEGAADPLNPQVIIDSGTGITSAVGQKGLGLLNLSTGSYDAVYYKAANGSGTATISLSRDDLNVGGIDFNASFQLDFFDNDDGGWGWTRMQEVRLDSAALGESSSEIAITGIHFSAVDNQLSLTWNSTENTTYAVKYSVDLIDWSSDLDDAVSAGPGSETTRVFDLGAAGLQGERKIFFRVERQPPG